MACMFIMTRDARSATDVALAEAYKGAVRGMTYEPQLCDKFVAFVDILGFQSKVEAMERGEGIRLSELLELCSTLSQETHVDNLADYGPIICPESRYNSRNLNLRSLRSLIARLFQPRYHQQE